MKYILKYALLIFCLFVVLDIMYFSCKKHKTESHFSFDSVVSLGVNVTLNGVSSNGISIDSSKTVTLDSSGCGLTISSLGVITTLNGRVGDIDTGYINVAEWETFSKELDNVHYKQRDNSMNGYLPINIWKRLFDTTKIHSSLLKRD